MRFEEVLRWCGEQQHGVAARAQLLEHGTRRQIEHRLKTGALVRMHESVYRVAAVPGSWEQDLMAACFAGGKWSVASYRSALALWDLPGGEQVIEVTSPRHRRARHDGMIPHESRYLTDRFISYRQGIPVTRPARTLCDAAALVRRLQLGRETLELAVHEALRRDLVDLTSLWRTWEQLGGVRRHGGDVMEVMLRTLVPPDRRADSTAELVLLQKVRAGGFPEPVLQHRVWFSPTRHVVLDFAWPEHRTCMEFDSYKYHGSRMKFSRDKQRELELQSRGWERISVDDDELDAGAPRALAALALMLERSGRRDRSRAAG